MNLNQRTIAVFSVTGIAASLLFAVAAFLFMQRQALDEMEHEATSLMMRSARMFMVSTKKFHDQVNSAGSPDEKAAIHQKWMETIFAVDDAVVNDFGPEMARVRLVNDQSITGLLPLGGDNTAARIPFEREALKALKANPKDPVKTIDGEFLRLAVALPAGAHLGCATCHAMAHGKTQYPPETLFGSLNVYVPAAAPMAQARNNAIFVGIVLTAVFIAFSLVLGGWVVRKITKPLGGEPHYAISIARRIAEGDLTGEVLVDRGGENSLLDNLRAMQAKLSQTIRDVRGSADQLANSASRLSDVSARVAGASAQQSDAAT